MNICLLSRNQVNVTISIIVANAVMNVTRFIEHLYRPVLSTKILKRIAPITPENNIVSAMIDRSDGLKPKGSNKLDINAPTAIKAPKGSA